MKLRYDQHGNISEMVFFGDGWSARDAKETSGLPEKHLRTMIAAILSRTLFSVQIASSSSELWVLRSIRSPGMKKADALGTFFGPDGKPIPMFGKVIKLSGTYDKRGYIVEGAGFDENDRARSRQKRMREECHDP